MYQPKHDHNGHAIFSDDDSSQSEIDMFDDFSESPDIIPDDSTDFIPYLLKVIADPSVEKQPVITSLYENYYRHCR
jgi:hypothetical protein